MRVISRKVPCDITAWVAVLHNIRQSGEPI